MKKKLAPADKKLKYYNQYNYSEPPIFSLFLVFTFLFGFLMYFFRPQNENVTKIIETRPSETYENYVLVPELLGLDDLVKIAKDEEIKKARERFILDGTIEPDWNARFNSILSEIKRNMIETHKGKNVTLPLKDGSLITGNFQDATDNSVILKIKGDFNMEISTNTLYNAGQYNLFNNNFLTDIANKELIKQKQEWADKKIIEDEKNFVHAR
jgi:hypothetical protein